MPVRAVHHSLVVRARMSANWNRVRAAMRAPVPARYPIPLLLPCEILLIVCEWLPPEACACLVNCCKYMRGLYCEDGSVHTEQLWNALLRRTFPQRYTGAPGPNAPPRVRGSCRIGIGVLAREWVECRRLIKAAPRMTGVQIAKFVRWASSAHSWYKHLPQQEAAVFSFVLDLSVAMKRTPGGFVEQHEGEARTHYSWLPTRAYREAFGLLTYRDALPAFQPATTGSRSVCVQRLSGARVWIPAHFVEKGSCHVTAACHGRAESYEIYHHPYEAYVQARNSGGSVQHLQSPGNPGCSTSHAGGGGGATGFGFGGGSHAASPVSPGPGFGNGGGSSFGSFGSFSSADGWQDWGLQVDDGEGEGGVPPSAESPLRHSYSYLNKEAQKQHFRSLPQEVLRDFELLYAFQNSGLDHTAEAQCALIQKLFPRLSLKQCAKLQDRRVWGSPWQPGGAYLGAPNVVVTAQKAREWQRMFDAAAAFCEAIYGERISMEGVKPCTMTCLALETLPLPAYDLLST